MRRPLLVLLSALAACGGSENPSDAASAATEVEVLVAREGVSIGELAGDEPYLFGGVSDASRLSDGSIAVADCQAGELRLFDPNGQHLRTVGGVGDGPGEFRFLGRLFPMRGDSLAAYDRMAGRVSIFEEDGTFARSFNAGGMMRGFMVIGALADGRWVARVTPERPDTTDGIVYRLPDEFVLLDPDGAPTDTLGPFAGSEEVAGGPGVGGEVRLGRRSRIAISPAGIAHSVGDDAGVLLLGPDGDDSARVQPLAERVARGGDEEARWADAYMTELAFPEGGTALPAYADVFADSLPRHGDMYLDEEGSLWLQDFPTPWSYSLMWTQYVDGEPNLRVQLPPRFFPFEFHPDAVLGVLFDENSVERVQLLDLVPGDTLPVAGTPQDFQPPWIGRCGFHLAR